MGNENLRFLVLATSLDANYINTLDKKWRVEVKCLETGERREYTVTRSACNSKAPLLIDVIKSFQTCTSWNAVEAVA